MDMDPASLPPSSAVIERLAGHEGRRLDLNAFRSGETPDDDGDATVIPDTVSYILLTSSEKSGRLHAVGQPGSFESHDNAPRMPFVCAFLNRMVLPYMSSAASHALAKRCGRLAIELHDTYKDSCSAGATIYDRDSAFRNTLVFSRDQDHKYPVLIPDPFQMGNYGNMLDTTADRVDWREKTPKMFFAGTTTGHRDPTKNERIRRCVWSLDHRDIADFFVTRIAQMDPRQALSAVPALARTLNHRFSEDHHTKYRIGANIAGNTCSWSRIPAVMNTRTVLFDFAYPDVAWYSPAMRDGVHYVSVNDDNVVAKYHEYVADARKCAAMADCANALVRDYMRPVHAAQYTRHLLETAVENSAP